MLPYPYKSSGDIRYYYKLEGLDGKWKTTTTSDFVNLKYLNRAVMSSC